jgi:hypothetical protein
MKSLKRKNPTKADDLQGHQLKKFKKTSNNNYDSSEDEFIRENIKGDGNCLFRAILSCLFRDDEGHLELRKLVCEYMQEHVANFSNYMTIDFDDYINQMRKNRTWGTYIELFAASEILLFNFTVFDSHSRTVYCSFVHSESFETIYLEFENGNHFNSLFKKENFRIRIQLGGSAKKSTFDDYHSKLGPKKKMKMQTVDNLEKLHSQMKITISKSTVKQVQNSMGGVIEPTVRSIHRKSHTKQRICE